MNESDRLLEWYDKGHRCLPWRSESGIPPDAYRVWLSEIMLQQTTVTTVIPYFLRFERRWPRIGALADAELDEILVSWAGLGYYARARNMHACARIVRDAFGRKFPDSYETMVRLPGIGRYTASAISAIAYGKQIVPVDTNVARIMARYHGVEEPMTSVRGRIEEYAQGLLPCERPGDLVQSLMDLGALICRPRSPACHQCPLHEGCAGYRRGIAESLPIKEMRKKRPIRYTRMFWLERKDGSVLLRRRPLHGLLGGMQELPSSSWTSHLPLAPDTEDPQGAPVRADWHRVPGIVRHVFTHFELIIEIWKAEINSCGEDRDPLLLQDDRFVHKSALKDEALPNMVRKVMARILDESAIPVQGTRSS